MNVRNLLLLSALTSVFACDGDFDEPDFRAQTEQNAAVAVNAVDEQPDFEAPEFDDKEAAIAYLNSLEDDGINYSPEDPAEFNALMFGAMDPSTTSSCGPNSAPFKMSCPYQKWGCHTCGTYKAVWNVYAKWCMCSDGELVCGGCFWTHDYCANC
jgi:hypothetical protein